MFEGFFGSSSGRTNRGVAPWVRESCLWGFVGVFVERGVEGVLYAVFV